MYSKQYYNKRHGQNSRGLDDNKKKPTVAHRRPPLQQSLHIKHRQTDKQTPSEHIICTIHDVHVAEIQLRSDGVVGCGPHRAALARGGKEAKNAQN